MVNIKRTNPKTKIGGNIIIIDSAIDREYDIIGAKKVGIASMGILYGYGHRNELEIVDADFIVNTVGDIGKILFE